MNYSRVDEALLDKNIKEIELYKTEEEKTLNKICEKLISATQSYQSENTAQILNNIEITKTKIAPLKAKREKSCCLFQYHHAACSLCSREYT